MNTDTEIKPEEKPQRLRSGAYALCFASALPQIQAIARERGYAIAVHGSMATDFDLIACPWTTEAGSAKELVEAIREAVGGVIRNEQDHNPAWKPHGRLAWSIYLQKGNGPYIDISVMPRRREGEHYDNEATREIDEKFGLNDWICDGCGHRQVIVGGVAGISHCENCKTPQTFHRA